MRLNKAVLQKEHLLNLVLSYTSLDLLKAEACFISPFLFRPSGISQLNDEKHHLNAERA
jgi:hypothetical protein